MQECHSIENFFAKHKIELRSVVDIGAEIGKITLYCAEKNPKARILAIEGSSRNFSVLQKNIQRSGFNNIILINKLVSDRVDTIDVSTGRGSENTIILDKRNLRIRYEPQTEKVQSDTLSNLLRQHNFDYVDFMKIDIEGGEPLLYESLKRYASDIKSLFIEFGYMNTKDSYFSLLELLFEKGFLCFKDFGEELTTLKEAQKYFSEKWDIREITNLWFLQKKHANITSQNQRTLSDCMIVKDEEEFMSRRIESFEKQIEENPNNTFAWLNFNQILRDKGEFNRAVENGKHALSLESYEEDPGTYLMLLDDTVYCCLMSGRLDEGEKLCQEGLKHNRKNLDLLCTLANIYFRKKRYDDAINAYQEFLKQREIAEKSPNVYSHIVITWSFQSIVRNNIAQCYRLLGDYEKAIDYLKNAIAQDDQPLDLYKSLAFLYCFPGKRHQLSNLG